MKLTLGLVARPGTARVNKTGSWRTNKKPKFKQENCTGCNLCSISCPDGCISGEGKNTYNNNLDYCKGCGICSKVCPANDIEMIPEEAVHG